MDFDGFPNGFDEFWWILMDLDGFWLKSYGFWWIMMDGRIQRVKTAKMSKNGARP